MKRLIIVEFTRKTFNSKLIRKLSKLWEDAEEIRMDFQSLCL